MSEHDDDDDLERIRRRLEEVDDLDVSERPEVFAEVNEAIVAELETMEDV